MSVLRHREYVDNT